ncbi:MAG: hypothetical protein IIA67_14010 [Planctomycetes bacterium]|nr:hypothetical protein [Planctomycetota bacterium]
MLPLTDAWRDGLAIGAFVVTLVSLWYAIWQIRRTTTAAKAAEKAAKRTLDESRDQFQQFAVATALRFIAEVRTLVNNKMWPNAALRLDDLADYAGKMANLTLAGQSERQHTWTELARELREWAITCRDKADRSNVRFSRKKWETLLLQVQAIFEAYHGPFNIGTSESRDDNE